MSGRKKRDIGGIVTMDEVSLRWSVKSEPIRRSTDGDIGLRLSIVKDDETLTRHGKPKAWRELVLQFPFEKRRILPRAFPTSHGLILSRWCPPFAWPWTPAGFRIRADARLN